jgi:hypothetical protein
MKKLHAALVFLLPIPLNCGTRRLDAYNKRTTLRL